VEALWKGGGLLHSPPGPPRVSLPRGRNSPFHPLLRPQVVHLGLHATATRLRSASTSTARGIHVEKPGPPRGFRAASTLNPRGRMVERSRGLARAFCTRIHVALRRPTSRAPRIPSHSDKGRRARVAETARGRVEGGERRQRTLLGFDAAPRRDVGGHERRITVARRASRAGSRRPSTSPGPCRRASRSCRPRRAPSCDRGRRRSRRFPRASAA
jgi:hypothetical protein